MQIDERSEIKKIANKANIKGKTLIEIGCGQGRLTKSLARYAKYVTAIDPSEKDIKEARKKIKAKNIKFKVCSAEKLDCNKNSFDMCIYSLSFHHIPLKKQKEVLKTSSEFIKKGGKIVIYEPVSEGEVQKIFNLFEGKREVKGLDNTYRIIKSEEIIKIYKPRRVQFEIKWRFRDIDELKNYFTKLFGSYAFEENFKEIKQILSAKIKKSPLILNDKLVMIILKVS